MHPTDDVLICRWPEELAVMLQLHCVCYTTPTLTQTL